MSLYVSTSCLKDEDDLFTVLDSYCSNGISHVELGIGRKPAAPLSRIKQYGLSLLAHHYFPPPRHRFVVNLASQDAALLAQSIAQVKRSIDFCSRFDIPLFSFHAGFCADPDSGFCFSRSPQITPYHHAFDTFVTSVKEVNTYAQARGVKLAIENNVLSRRTLQEGINRLLLLCEASEFEKLWERIPCDNLGILLDLGHLRVSASWLGFDADAFIERVKGKISALHINDNDGRSDTHGRVDKGSWCLETISRHHLAGVPIILESANRTIAEVKQQVGIIENVLGYEKARGAISYG